MNDETILVTGSAGFIGSNLCHHLISLGHHVVGLDNFSIGSNLKNCPENFRTYATDLAEPYGLNVLFDNLKITKVVHLAAATHVDRSIENGSLFYRSNVIGTHNLLEACKDSFLKNGYPRVVINQLSDECYGSREYPVGEETSFRPSSPYAASKVAQYYVGYSFSNTYGLPIYNTFPTNTFGPRQWPEKIIPKFVLRLLRGQKVPLMASTQFKRDWLFIDDHVKALCCILDNPTKEHSFNIGADNWITNQELTNLILEHLGMSKDMIEIVPDRSGHDSCYAVDWSRMNFVYDWEPEPRSFVRNLFKTIDWYKEHQDWYSEVEL